jgi:hypothetical protein
MTMCGPHGLLLLLHSLLDDVGDVCGVSYTWSVRRRLQGRRPFLTLRNDRCVLIIVRWPGFCVTFYNVLFHLRSGPQLFKQQQAARRQGL